MYESAFRTTDHEGNRISSGLVICQKSITNRENGAQMENPR